MQSRGIRLKHALGLCLIVLAIFLSEKALASDEFIAGYASAILEHEFSVTDASVEVLDGRLIVTTKSLANGNRGKIEMALKQISGVTEVEIREADPSTSPPVPGAVRATIPEPHAKWLPRSLLFAPLHADPRWPQ